MFSTFVFFASVGCNPETRYQHLLDSVDAPGGQLSVIDASGSDWSGSTGIARTDLPMTTENTLLVGSNTKMFIAAVVLQLVEEGRLSLEDSASTWVPQLDPAITVRSLLQQTSGLGEYSDHDVMTVDDAAAMEDPWTPEELITLGQEVASDPPGDTVHYANTNYIALGLVVEAVEAEALERVLEVRVFEPLGLDRAGLAVDVAEVPDHIAWGNGGEWGKPTLWDLSVGWAAGAVYASTSDLTRFLQAVFAGELYSAELLAEQLEPAPWDELDSEGVDLSYGLGMTVAEVDGALFYGHQGGVAGATSLVLIDPDTGAVVAVAYNETNADVVSPGFGALQIAMRQ